MPTSTPTYPVCTRLVSGGVVAVFITLVAVLSLLSASEPARAQVDSGGGSGGTADGGSPYADSGKAVQFAAIPVPSYNPNLGWGIGALVTGFYKIDRADTLCPPSSTGLFGFYAENKTYIYGLWQELYLDEDTWRGQLVFARASVNFQTYLDEDIPIVGGKWINYNTSNYFFRVQARRITWSHIYLGLQYRFRESNLVFDLDIPEEYRGRTLKYSGLGLLASFDTRDNIFNPANGWYIDLESVFNRDWIGSEKNYDKWDLKFTQYLGLKPRNVLAWQLVGQVGTGDVPFDDQAIIGVQGLRGYASGKYRGDGKIFGEAEYRWNFYGRWGMVGFLGVGWAFDSISQISTNDALPSIGTGIRYMMISSYRINVGVDVAVGNDETVLYFRIGEAF